MASSSKRRRAGNPRVPLRESKRAKQERASAVLAKLIELYPAAKTALDYRDPFELLVATLLSAQCTDKRVNQETPALFAAFPNATSMAKATVDELREYLKSINFYNNKAKNLHKTANMLVDKHDGEVPDTMEELTALAGVARKTANCVLGQGFGKPLGVVVDTHVGRIARRMNFTVETDPVKIERDLMQLFPQERWVFLSHAWIDLGRPTCTARNAKCDECEFASLCPQVRD